MVVPLLTAGCASIGPGTVSRDRFDYTTAIAESWKSQMLLNIVKLRYSDTPIFLDVPSVINQYAISGRVTFGANWSSNEEGVDDFVATLDGNSQSIGAEGIYAERPTITYSPLAGEKFTKSLLTPIPPASLLSLVQSGWPVKLLFEVCVKSINDMDNRSTAFGMDHEVDPGFQKLVEAIANVQAVGGMGARIIRKGNQSMATLLIRKELDPRMAADIKEIRSLLGIKPDATEVSVTYGVASLEDNEIAMLTRSTMDIILEMSSQVDVPAEHVAEGRTFATPALVSPDGTPYPCMSRIYVSKSKPTDAFAMIKYRGHWFWIDDRDRSSKSRITFLFVLFSLAETGTVPQAPLITVPIN